VLADEEDRRFEILAPAALDAALIDPNDSLIRHDKPFDGKELSLNGETALCNRKLCIRPKYLPQRGLIVIYK
jgi:hypothetical protein